MLPRAKKDTANPFYKSRYADLAACWDAVQVALPPNGLSVIQLTRASEKDEVIVVTRLCHSSGEWIEGELSLPVSKADAQGYGSALTYARRYGLCAIVGIAPEEDDGNAAAQAKPLPKAIPANVEGQDIIASMPEDEQKFLRDYATAVVDLHEGGGDVMGYLASHTLDNEEKLALWTLLPAKVRGAIKTAQREMNGSK